MFPFTPLTIIFYNSNWSLNRSFLLALVRAGNDEHRERWRENWMPLQYGKHTSTGLDSKAFWRWKRINKKIQQQLCNNSLPRIARLVPYLLDTILSLQRRRQQSCWVVRETSQAAYDWDIREPRTTLLRDSWRRSEETKNLNWLLMITFASIAPATGWKFAARGPAGNFTILRAFRGRSRGQK